MQSLKVSVPIYYTIVRKTKPSSTHLVGDNWVRNLHPHTKNTVKQHYHSLIASGVVPPPSHPLQQFVLSLQIFYKTHTCDPSNIAHQMEKYALDGFKAIGAIVDDSCLYHMLTVMLPPIKDALNPRCEITLTEFPQPIPERTP